MSWEIAVGRIVPGWLWRLYQVLRMRPYPDPRIIEIEPTGGGTHVDLHAHVVNNGTQRCRCTFSARVGEVVVQCVPTRDDLLANSPTTLVRIHVPRPQLGDLIEQFGDEPTLYGKTLQFELTSDKRTRSLEWREKVYAPEEDRERHEIQQRLWRRGRGEETENDLREEWREERIRRIENPEENGPPYDWTV
jgi:hypothetical protein